MNKRNFFLLAGILLCLIALGTYYVVGSNQKVSTQASASNTMSQTPQDEKTCPHLFVSWNLANFGRSKSQEVIGVMAEVLRDADVVAVQEVTAGKEFGVQAVASLVDTLSRKGADWDYTVSSPTLPSSPGVERYAYLTKKGVAQFSRSDAHLLSEVGEAIDREPFALKVSFKKSEPILFFTMHAVPTKKNPFREVKALTDSQEVREVTRAIFSGDFNLGPRDTNKVFEGMLKYTSQVSGKTSLKTKVGQHGEYLAYQYDNIFTKGVVVCEAGVIDFVSKHFSPVTNESLKKAREVSDHLPVYIRFK